MGAILFLAAEAAGFTVLLSLSWNLTRRAFALLEVRVAPPAWWRILAVWALLLATNLAFTHQRGPSFTALYRLSGLVLAGSCGLYLLCRILRRSRTTQIEER